ncbi:MAG TPA: DUF2726 domain-containing protein [Rhodothermales bacterium]
MSRRRDVLIDHEHLFRLIHESRWNEAAGMLHRHHEAVAADPLLRQASDVFVSSVSNLLESSSNETDTDLLERLFLLHQGRFVTLPPNVFERVVVGLVEANAHRPEAALAYARYCASHPRCAAVLEALGDPVRERVAHDRAEHIDVVSSHSDAPDASRPLLRSGQEESFFRAVREVFATYLVYPNVALSAVLDYELMKPRLSAEERRYFFHALVDCVVFDQQNEYRPRFFFELDSPLHDDHVRQERDLMKDRILSAAGQRLFRIRCRSVVASSEDFARLIRQTVG